MKCRQAYLTKRFFERTQNPKEGVLSRYQRLAGTDESEEEIKFSIIQTRDIDANKSGPDTTGGAVSDWRGVAGRTRLINLQG